MTVAGEPDRCLLGAVALATVSPLALRVVGVREIPDGTLCPIADAVRWGTPPPPPLPPPPPTLPKLVVLALTAEIEEEEAEACLNVVAEPVTA